MPLGIRAIRSLKRKGLFPSTELTFWRAASDRPLLEYLLVIIFISIYGVVLQVGTYWSVDPSGILDLIFDQWVAVLSYFGILVLAGVFGQLCWKVDHLTLSTDRLLASIPTARTLPLLIIVLHLCWYWVFTGPLLAHPGMLFIAFIEGIILALVVGRSNDPVLPTRLDRIAEKNQVDFLKIDLANFWRWTQIVMSFLFAFGIGVAAASPSLATSTVSVELVDIVLHSILSAIGLIYLSVYVLWKMNAMEAVVVEQYSNPED